MPRLWDRAVKRWSSRHFGAYREVGADFVDGLQGMTTLKAFNATPDHRRTMLARTRALYRDTMRHLAVSVVDGALTALGQGAGAARAIGVALVAGGSLDVASLFLILVLARGGPGGRHRRRPGRQGRDAGRRADQISFAFYPPAIVSDAEVDAAAERALVAEFVPDLPEGLDTVIGERGAMLSGANASASRSPAPCSRTPRCW